jgi:hypothetical protein
MNGNQVKKLKKSKNIVKKVASKNNKKTLKV